MTKDDQLYILIPVSKNTSPLDIDGIDVDITTKDIVQFVHDSRRGYGIESAFIDAEMGTLKQI